MNDITDALKAAQNAAGTVVNELGGAQAPAGTDIVQGSVNQAGTAVAYSKPSMSTVAAATGIIPRSIPYLKVNEFGLRVGKAKKFITDPFKAVIDMSEDRGFMLKWTLRYGNPAQYVSTFDGQVADKGGMWIDAISKARMLGAKEDPYPAVDAVLTLVDDLDFGGDAPLQAGSQLAFSSSKSNFSEWEDFYNVCANAGLLNQKVIAEVCYREVNHNQNTWGVVTFKLLEAAE